MSMFDLKEPNVENKALQRMQETIERRKPFAKYLDQQKKH